MEKRELDRLEASLKQLPQTPGITRVLMTHFPPLAWDASPGVITEVIDRYNVDFCVYGHVHGQKEAVPAISATVGKTKYMLTSCDWLQMRPIHVCDFTA
jgi:predicted phosphohydrolase